MRVRFFKPVNQHLRYDYRMYIKYNVHGLLLYPNYFKIIKLVLKNKAKHGYVLNV